MDEKQFLNFRRPPGYRYKTGDKWIDEIGNKIKKKMGGAVHELHHLLEGEDKLISTEKSLIVEPGAVDIEWRGPDTRDYRAGGHGMTAWCEDFVHVAPDSGSWIPITALSSTPNPETGRSWAWLWQQQKTTLQAALAMENGRFRYDTIIFCYPRGEAKSFLTCLIVMWLFFNFSRQKIVLGASSKDQSDFVHMDIIKDLILHSPDLVEQVGRQNIQVQGIRLREGGLRGAPVSNIWPIPSAQGILSNITAFTFSEIFLMKDDKFFSQLDSSRRNQFNSLGIIDSTVSTKQHILYRLFKAWLMGKNKKIFFDHRSSQTGRHEDYLHPNMTQAQLDGFRVKFDESQFDSLFLNTWSAGAGHLFAPHLIDSMDVLGVNGKILNVTDIFATMKKLGDLELSASDARRENKESAEFVIETEKLLQGCTRLSSIFTIAYQQYINLSVINTLSDIFKTDWAVLAGIDMGDALAKESTARTIVAVLLKGLVGSRIGKPTIDREGVPRYLYILVGLHVIPENSGDAAAAALDKVDSLLDGIDSICIEKFAGEAVANWTKNNFFNTSVIFEPVAPTYPRQKEAFTDLGIALREGRFKAPMVNIPGTKKRDILREEFSVFTHDAKAKKYGSPEKTEKHGIRDDCMYAIAWALYGGRSIGVDGFRVRQAWGAGVSMSAAASAFGSVYQDGSVHGDYDASHYGNYNTAVHPSPMGEISVSANSMMPSMSSTIDGGGGVIPTVKQPRRMVPPKRPWKEDDKIC